MQRQEFFKQDSYLRQQAEDRVAGYRRWELGQLALSSRERQQAEEAVSFLAGLIVDEAEESARQASKQQLVTV